MEGLLSTGPNPSSFSIIPGVTVLLALVHLPAHDAREHGHHGADHPPGGELVVLGGQGGILRFVGESSEGHPDSETASYQYSCLPQNYHSIATTSSFMSPQ